MLSGSGSFLLQGPTRSRPVPGGYDNDYPVAGKVVAKAMYYRAADGFPGSSGTPGTSRIDSVSSRSGPYSWPPELTERAGP